MFGMMQQAASALAAAPANDAFAAVQQLSGTSATGPGTTVEATLEAGEPSHLTSGNGSVWYSWTAPQDLVLRLDTCSGPGATKVQLYRGSSLATLDEVQPRADSPNCTGVSGGDLRRFNVVAGTTYRISVIEYASDTSFTLALSAAPTPSNDDFATPQSLGQQRNVDVDGTTVGTTLQPGEQGYFGSASDGESVWYRWTAPKRMRVWIDNCDAASNSEVAVYKGTALGSLSEVGPHYGNPQAPGCGGAGLFGARSEFLATAGTTYSIRVYSDLYADGAFHLRMREILFDGSLSQSASATSIKRGKTVTYRALIRNVGTIPINPWVDLVTSKPRKLAQPVVGTKYVSIATTSGTCSRVKFFGVEPGAICKPGNLAPGDSMRITARVRPSQSLSHWIELDYAHGGDSPIFDDNRANEANAPRTTIVKPAHH